MVKGAFWGGMTSKRRGEDGTKKNQPQVREEGWAQEGILDSHGGSAAEQIPREVVDSSFLEIFKQSLSRNLLEMQ